MSGIEIAGLVLGAVPLIIGALEKYSDAAERYDKFKRHQRYLTQACRLLKAEQRVYQNICMGLLTGIIPRHKIALLIQNGPKQTGDWRCQEFEDTLRRRLACDYDVFAGLMEEMKIIVGEFAKKLNLDEKFQFREGHKLGILMRLKFFLQNPNYLEFVETLHLLNETLRNLSQQYVDLDQGSDRETPDTQGISRVRKYASTVHCVLQACFNRPCCMEHTASIRLETPREDLFHVSATGRMAPCFSFLLSFTTEQSSPCSMSTPWTTETAKISVPKQPLNGSTWKNSVKKANEEIFGFCIPSYEQVPGACPPSISWRKFELCDAFCNPTQWQDTTYSGHLLDDTNHSHGQFVLDLPGKKPQPLSVASLRSLLKPGAAFSVPGLTATKMQLAMDVAHRVMELHDTPWLGSDWGNNHVVFLQTVDGPQLDSSYMLSNSLGGPRRGQQYSWTHLQPRNRTIFGLGVLLVEIGLGLLFDDAIELMKTQTKDGADLVNPWNAIVELVKRVYDETDKNYGEAVERCLFCDFGQLHVGFDRDDFYGIFYAKVVSRLERTNFYLST